ncbi:MAG: Gfo/Idh/MocA family oxidoreductase [archaeon]
MIPRILLVGCGKFGRHHLRVLKKLENDKKIILSGVVTKTAESSKRIAETDNVNTYTSLSKKILEEVDGVIIATPVTSHFEITKQCLEHASVFVEKPLALKLEEINELERLSEKFKHKVMVGHIYRFNNALMELKERISGIPEITIRFTGGTRSEDTGVLFEYMHVFDILDILLGTVPINVQCKQVHFTGKIEDHVHLEMDYPNAKASVILSWIYETKERTIRIRTADEDIFCDLVSQNISNMHYMDKEPLELELECFVNIYSDDRIKYPDITIAKKIGNIFKMAYDSLIA